MCILYVVLLPRNSFILIFEVCLGFLDTKADPVFAGVLSMLKDLEVDSRDFTYCGRTFGGLLEEREGPESSFKVLFPPTPCFSPLHIQQLRLTWQSLTAATSVSYDNSQWI